jgi:hypothetical protein
VTRMRARITVLFFTLASLAAFAGFGFHTGG